MATEFETLRLTVDLADNASNQIAKIRRELQDLGSSSSAGGLDRMRRQSEELRGRITRWLPRPASSARGRLVLRVGFRVLATRH